MLYLKSWLEDYIDLSKISNSELSDLISLNSGEVEEFFEIEDWFDSKVVVGKIENTQKHPDADRLKIFEVNLGEKGKVRIVSAASNVADGKIVPVALVGARLAYQTIVERKMRGENSQGMCLGKSELMLETEFSPGLWELEEEFKAKNREVVLGESICKAFPEYFPKQVVFEIKYLQDKIGSLGCHLGLALEIAYILKNNSLLKPKAQRILDSKKFYNLFQEKAIRIKNSTKKANFEDKTGFTNIFSLFEVDLNPQEKADYEYNLPFEIQQRMFFTQKNLIGGVADLSNYLLFDVGQPSHFFTNSESKEINWKIEKLKQPKKFKGLGRLKDVEIPVGVEVILENEEIVWIPGISGSEKQKVTEKDSFFGVEVANFEKERVAQSSFSLNYRSDSARFWNSNVNIPTILVWILHLIENLDKSEQEFTITNLLNWFNKNHPIAKFCSSTENQLEFYRSLLEYQNFYKIKINKQYLASRIDSSSQEKNLQIVDEFLPLIGELKENFLYPNIFYGNIFTQEEVLFEIVKLHGLNNLKDSYLQFSTNSSKEINLKRILDLKKFIASFGFDEIITRPLVTKNLLLSNFLETDIQSITAISTQREDQDKLKDSHLPILLEVLSNNISRGEKEICIFELERLYRFDTQLKEFLEADLLTMDQNPTRLTSLIFSLARKTSSDVGFDSLETKLGKGFEYTIGGGIKASLLELKNKIKKAFQIPLGKKIWWLNLDFTNWDYSFDLYNSFVDETDFPKLTRSFSLSVKTDTKWYQILTILSSEKIEDSEINIFPRERIYIQEEEVLNFDIEFFSFNRNLTNEQVATWQEKAFSKLEENLSIKLR